MTKGGSPPAIRYHSVTLICWLKVTQSL